MPHLRFISALVFVGLLPSTAQASSQLDGTWNCSSFGQMVATIEVVDNKYVLTNQRGSTAAGTFEDDPAVKDGFLVTDGPLVYGLMIVSGTYSLTEKNEPMLTMIGQFGDKGPYCYLK